MPGGVERVERVLGQLVPWEQLVSMQHTKFKTFEELDEDFKQIKINNERWIERVTSSDPNYLLNLANAPQKPKYLFVGCSDSRVPVDQIMGLPPGSVFVHRNIGNVVVNTDLNFLSVLQYSVEVLDIKHIIVCGHYGCGGVMTAMNRKDYGLIENW